MATSWGNKDSTKLTPRIYCTSLTYFCIEDEPWNVIIGNNPTVCFRERRSQVVSYARALLVVAKIEEAYDRVSGLGERTLGRVQQSLIGSSDYHCFWWCGPFFWWSLVALDVGLTALVVERWDQKSSILGSSNTSFSKCNIHGFSRGVMWDHSKNRKWRPRREPQINSKPSAGLDSTKVNDEIMHLELIFYKPRGEYSK